MIDFRMDPRVTNLIPNMLGLDPEMVNLDPGIFKLGKRCQIWIQKRPF